MGFGSKKFWGGLAQAVGPVAAGVFGGPLGATITNRVLAKVFEPREDDDVEQREDRKVRAELYEGWVRYAELLDDNPNVDNGERWTALTNRVSSDLEKYTGSPTKLHDIMVNAGLALKEARKEF